MANAPGEVKAHADHVTTSNDDGGARVLERLVD
jgi:hydroxymethylpyrimidine pyrophosphatase-like HAD family hydrolase